MELVDYLPILIQIVLAAVIAGAILVASHMFGQRASGNYTKDDAYECGLKAEGKPHPKFSVKFYVVAMLFILFDIEVVFLIPWVLVYREMLSIGIPILLPVLFFLGILTLGMAYEMKKKGLEWER
ncbi:MAG: NADH-quinone oxidoreductase subunit A [Puniceicoccales bacterium]